jgi:hypothetical protein
MRRFAKISAVIFIFLILASPLFLSWGNIRNFWSGLIREKKTVPTPSALEIGEKDVVWCGDACFWLDSRGKLWQEAPFTEGTLMPSVTDIGSPGLKKGDSVLDEGEATNLRRIISFMRQNGLPFASLKVEDLGKKELTAETISGPRILFSFRFSPESASSVVSGLKNSAEWPKISYIDLRVEDRIYYKNR